MADTAVELPFMATSSPPSPVSPDSPGEEHSSSGSTDYSATQQSDYAAVAKGDVEDWTATGVRYWLSNMGLDHYYQVFANNDWDNGRALVQLKEADIYPEALTFHRNATSSASADLDEQIRADVRNPDGLMLSSTIDAYLRAREP